MINLILAIEWASGPLWVQNTFFEPIDLESLPLTSETIAKLRDWQARIDTLYELGPGMPFKSAEEQMAFVCEGVVLWKLLLSELGDGYSVRYRPGGYGHLENPNQLPFDCP